MTKVLVAEDERRIRELLLDTLFDLGYDVIEATDGGEALKKAGYELPDLVLLDVMMPVMDGFEVLRRLRETPSTEAIPVVILTAVSALEGEQEAYQLGVNHYITKPFDPDSLESTIKVALRAARTDAGPEHDAAPQHAPAKIWSGSTSYLSMPTGPKSEETIPLGELLAPLERILGGGIRPGSLTLVEGPSATGKSVLCQHFAFGALQDDRGVAFFTSQSTPRLLATQMSSIGLNPSEYTRSGKLDVYPLPEPTTGVDSGELLTALTLDIERLQGTLDVVVVDAITNLASTSQGHAVMGFFSACKRMCSKGRTIVVVAHSSAFDADLLGRVSAVAESHLRLSTGKTKGKVVRKLEAAKVDDVGLIRDNEISFEVQPGVGIQIIPFSQVKT